MVSCHSLEKSNIADVSENESDKLFSSDDYKFFQRCAQCLLYNTNPTFCFCKLCYRVRRTQYLNKSQRKLLLNPKIFSQMRKEMMPSKPKPKRKLSSVVQPRKKQNPSKLDTQNNEWENTRGLSGSQGLILAFTQASLKVEAYLELLLDLLLLSRKNRLLAGCSEWPARFPNSATCRGASEKAFCSFKTPGIHFQGSRGLNLRMRIMAYVINIRTTTNTPTHTDEKKLEDTRAINNNINGRRRIELFRWMLPNPNAPLKGAGRSTATLRRILFPESGDENFSTRHCPFPVSFSYTGETNQL